MRINDIPNGEELSAWLADLPADRLERAEAVLTASFDQMMGGDQGASADLVALAARADQIESVRTEVARRAAAAAEHSTEAAAIAARVHTITTLSTETPETPEGGDAPLTGELESEDEPEGAEPEADTPEGEPEEGTENDSESSPDDAEETAPENTNDGGDAGEDSMTENQTPAEGSGADFTALAEAVAASVATAVTAALVPDRTAADLVRPAGRSLNAHLRPSLANAAAFAPNALVPAQAGTVFSASPNIPGMAHGAELRDMPALARAMHERARTMRDGRGTGDIAMVASMERSFRHTLGLDSKPEDIERVLADVTNEEAMVAAGGWCAPSEIRYDFFNLICEEGLLDLPSVGIINRGGLRYPTSPSMADILANSPDGLWTWTETDDQAAVTGSPTKDCVRVDCPDFNETRLVCDGLCVTAGNLMDFAYPENISNFLRLLFATRAHVTNARIISILQNASTGVTVGGPTGGISGDFLNAVELAGANLRAKFATCDDQIVEIVAPRWLHGAIRVDWARRTGIDNPILSDATLYDAFDAANVRVQFIQDYQVRGVGQIGAATTPTNWPATVEIMAYLPGTFVRGQGLNLNLGVIRDSTLNATNDYTAAWMEDCYLVAQLGWQSLKLTIPVCVAGETGAANIAC